MKTKIIKSKLLPAAIAVGFIAASMTSSMARPEYYYVYNGANFIYGSMGSCKAEGSSSCVNFGNFCGRKYASSKNTRNLAKLLWNEGKTVVITARGNNKAVCNVRP